MLRAFRVYFNSRMLSMALLGFACGLPVFLTWGTLNMRLHEAGISFKLIGFFYLVGIPYSLKFLMGPVLDHVKIPLLSKVLGQRRSWIFLSQFLLVLAVLALGFADPKKNLLWTGVCAFIVSLCSSFDQTAFAAYRIELLDKEEYGPGDAAVVFGYRIGTLFSGAFALKLAYYHSWEYAYSIMAMCGFIGIITILVNSEPKFSNLSAKTTFSKLLWGDFLKLIRSEGIFLILFFVVLFRLGDHAMGGVSNIFYAVLGFTKNEIANIIKIYGLIPTFLGGFLGGVITREYGVRKTLLWFGALEALSPFFHILQFYAGKDFQMLYFTVTVEHLTTGMAAAAFMTYMSHLCSSTPNTATTYSYLSSLKGFGLTVMGSVAMMVIGSFGWLAFYLACVLLTLPCLFILFRMKDKFPIAIESFKKG